MPSRSLTQAEIQALRERIERAIAESLDDFVRSTVIRDSQGLAVSGPDPKAVTTEMMFILLRIAARHS